MAKKQLRGVCPVCGSQQALNRGGFVAQHGYRRLFGMNVSECAGSRRPHFGSEKGRAFARSYAELLRERVAAEPIPEPAERSSLRDFAMFIENRVAQWKPADPVEVLVEDSRPIHLFAKIYGISAAACCVSANGAQRFNGRVTTVDSEVTCRGCLKAMERRAALLAKKKSQSLEVSR